MPPIPPMTAKKSAQDSATLEMHVSPFEQITNLENEQERRVLQAKERFDEEKRDMEKTIASSEKTQEETIRAQATEELKEYARTEPAAILKNAEKETSAELSAIAKHAEKHLPKAVEENLNLLLDGSLFTAA